LLKSFLSNNWISSFKTIAWRELKAIAADKMVFSILVMSPILYLIMFGLLYQAGVIVDLPIVVCDQDNSSISRSLVSYLEANEKITIGARVGSMQEFERLLQDGKVKGGVMIPAGFARGMIKGRSEPIMTVIDGSNLIEAFNLRKGLLSVIKSFKAESALKVMSANGIITQDAMPVLQALVFRDWVWYNPTYNYVYFIILGALVMALRQTPMMALCVSVTREKCGGTWSECLGYPTSALVAGKIAPYFAIDLAISGILCLMCNAWLSLPMHGSMLAVVSGMILYLLAVMAAALLISSLSRDDVEATAYVVLTGLPLFLISGYSWPVFLIDGWIRAIARLAPTTWMLELMREVTTKGGQFMLAVPYITALGCLCMVFLIILWALWRHEAAQLASFSE